jgi:GT2 family glycosyltransferase
MDITITIHNPTQITADCLDSFIKNREGVEKLIVVNNASTDNSFVNNFRAKADVYMNLVEQVSIGQSWNIGISKSTSKYILVSNDDIVFAPGWKEPLIKALEEDKNIGVLQPFNTLSTFPEDFPNNYKKRDIIGNIPDDNFIGCCFIVRRSILPELKVFDRAHFKDHADYTYFCDKFYPFGPEDQDFYRRVREIGYTTKTHFGSYVHHYTGETMKQIPNFEELKARGQKILDERWKNGGL